MSEATPLADDPEIPDDAVLWRRIPPWHFVNDKNLGKTRPSSAAFDDDSDGSPMSVLLKELVLQDGRNADAALVGLQGFALAAISAGFVRNFCNQIVIRTPQPNEPAHADVVGNKTGSVKRKMAKQSTWVIPPPNDP